MSNTEGFEEWWEEGNLGLETEVTRVVARAAWAASRAALPEKLGTRSELLAISTKANVACGLTSPKLMESSFPKGRLITVNALLVELYILVEKLLDPATAELFDE